MRMWFNFGAGAKKDNSGSGLDRDTVIFYGIAAAFIVFLIILGLDGYVFYKNVWGVKQAADIKKPELISAQEFEETVKLLKERAGKFNEISGGVNLIP